MPKIIFKHGTKSAMPKLDFREPGITDDTEEFFIGGNTANIQLAKQTDLDTTNTNVGDLTTLQTTDKSNLVNAMNENVAHLAQIVKQSSASEPTAGTWQLGDKIWNSNPQAGGNLGWICVQAGTFGTGTPPVFKQFGIISA